MNALIDLDGQLDALRSDTDRLATTLEVGDPNAAIAACPGWNLRALVEHVGTVHRWAAHAARHAAPPRRGDVTPPDAELTDAQVAAWLRDGVEPLIDTLATTDPNAETWHPFPFDQRAWVWSRRQMMETAVHRWDAEMATTATSTIDAKVAATGIREYFELGLPRVLSRDAVAVPEPSLHVHCTDDELPDGEGEWIIWNDAGNYAFEAAHRKGDAALRGTAHSLLLVLMGRADTSTVDVVGDASAAAAWLDLPGW